MKKLMTVVCSTFFLLMASSQGMAQTKPMIKVNFDVESGNALYSVFENEIENIKTQAAPILSNGLNTYIGFISFAPESGAHQLNIELKKDPLNAGIIEDYMLTFELMDSSGQAHRYTWKDFTDSFEVRTFGNSTEIFLEFLADKWDTYLTGAYNNELVANLFDQIPLLIPDSSHYYVSGDIREAILPFKNEELNMVLEDCEFSVIVNGKNTDGVDTKEVLKELTYSGLVEDNMTGIPSKLMRCIRIRLKSLSPMEPMDGLVFVTDYMRLAVPADATPNDFLTSVNPE